MTLERKRFTYFKKKILLLSLNGKEILTICQYIPFTKSLIIGQPMNLICCILLLLMRKSYLCIHN